MITFTFRLGQNNVSEKLRRHSEKLDMENLETSADLLDWITGDENVGGGSDLA